MTMQGVIRRWTAELFVSPFGAAGCLSLKLRNRSGAARAGGVFSHCYFSAPLMPVQPRPLLIIKYVRGIAGMIQTIVEEMTKGNFSFLILVVGVAQLVAMMRKK